MKTKILLNSILFFVFVSLMSCKENSDSIYQISMKGKWDTKKTSGDDFLWNYEQGFEVLNDGTYLPRYWNSDDSTWHSKSQQTSNLSWEVVEERNQTFLYFYQEYYSFQKTKRDTVFYALSIIDENTINLSGNNPHGHLEDIILYRTE